jgi:hypothetical protein
MRISQGTVAGSLLALMVGLPVLAQAQTQTTIAGWNFENNAVGVNNSPAPSTGAGTATSIGMNLYPTPNVGVTTDDILVGKSSDTGANGVADTTNTWRIRAQAGANGAANGWSSLAPIGTQGAVFAASTAGYSRISVSFDWYATTQGEANLQLEYTTNGLTWNNVALSLGGADAGAVVLSNASDPNTVVGSYVSNNILVGGASAGQDWMTGLTATILDPAAANNPNFAIELVNASTGVADLSTQGTALNNSSGNWRFDNVVISGVSAVPEPGTAALMALGGVAVALRSRRRLSWKAN